jgi:hypothetical protein
MRLRFECVDEKLIPGAAKRDEAQSAAGKGDDVDLIGIVERLRNVPKQQSALVFAEPVNAQLQPGDPGYRKPDAVAPKSSPAEEDLDFGYGLKPSTFGSRSR